jgi:nitric oxide dioxygenase
LVFFVIVTHNRSLRGWKFVDILNKVKNISMGLTPDQVKIIKATVPVLQEHGNTITTAFYKNILEDVPELNGVFNNLNQVNGHQQRALAGALFAYATHIDDLGALAPAVELICHRHASLYVQPDHYKVVGTYLLAAMKEVLGDALTPEIHDAWATAYWQLADLMIARESSLYEESDGWTNWREFTIAKKVPESDEITSFYLKPVDGKPLPSFHPGQYISVLVDMPGKKYPQPRQYSLSDKPSPDCYRITVRKEPGPDHVSNVLHDFKHEGDTIKVSHPFGDFFLTEARNGEIIESACPIVLISAGVGLTPLTSILNTVTAASTESKRKIHFIHGVRRGRARAFKDHVLSLRKQDPSLRVTFFNSSPSEDEKQGENYHYAGRIDLLKLDKNEHLFLDDPSTEYYVCGPTSFMEDMARSLKGFNVDPSRVHMELFGTGFVPAA